MEEQEFKQQAYILINEHIPGWTLHISGGKRTLGSCNHSKRQISVSRYWIELYDWEQIRHTVLHEIAHALTRYDGHGHKWRRECVRLGILPSRTNPIIESFSYDKKIAVLKPKYTYSCPNCDKKKYSFRRLKLKHACGQCCNQYNYGKYTEKFALVLEVSNGNY